MVKKIVIPTTASNAPKPKKLVIVVAEPEKPKPPQVKAKPKPLQVKAKPQKVFKKQGQKFDTPLKTDSLYRFYTSLLKQNPKSKMALKWCLEHGVLSAKKAEETTLILQFESMQLNKKGK